jgi:hypothetical protein
MLPNNQQAAGIQNLMPGPPGFGPGGVPLGLPPGVNLPMQGMTPQGIHPNPVNILALYQQS